MQVVYSMCMQAFSKGATILHQGATVGDDDYLYLLDTGEVDVVISGGHTVAEDHRVGLHLIKLHNQHLAARRF